MTLMELLKGAVSSFLSFLRKCDNSGTVCVTSVTFLAACHTCSSAQTTNYLTHIKTEMKAEKSFYVLKRK